MQIKRGKYQGVLNIVRFNWPFFFFTSSVLLLLLALGYITEGYLRLFILAAIICVFSITTISLLVSHHIYDRSNLYAFPFLDHIKVPEKASFINLTAGFDESTDILKDRFPKAFFRVFDFYNAETHTEPSVKRARKCYPLHHLSEQVDVRNLPAAPNSVDGIFGIFAAHEIRDRQERVLFFCELERVLKHDGKILITEHLRDLPNLIAYTIGAFHFHSRQEWLHTFQEAGLTLICEEKHTAFITTFTLQKHALHH